MSARRNTHTVLFLGALVAAPLVTAEGQQCFYCRESVQFCPGFSPTGDVLPGGTGPVMLVSTLPATTPFPIPAGTTASQSYAQFGSESLAGAPETVPDMPASAAGSTWMYVRGRWPIKQTKKLVAASYGTTVILEHQNVGTYERHRVYVLKDSATNPVVRVWLSLNTLPAVGGPPPQTQVNITFAGTDPVGTWKYVETVMTGGVEGLSVVTITPPVPPAIGSSEWQFANAIQTFANAAGKDLDTAASLQ